MPTTSKNPAGIPKWSIAAPLAVDASVAQGDRVKVSSNLIVKQAGANTDWFGVANFQNPDALNNGVTSAAILCTGSILYFVLTSGDTVNFNDALYCEADEQTVTTTSTTRKLAGYCRELAAVIGDGTRRVAVEIRPTVTGAP